MRSKQFRAGLITVLTAGCLYGEVSCIPSRDQFNSMISSSILSGISLAITLGIEEALSPGSTGLFGVPAATGDTTTETSTTEATAG